jgi:flagellar biosynthesis/type III secretory pathway protein FliH
MAGQLRHNFRTCRDRECRRLACEAYRQGFEDGHDDGYREGFKDGILACPGPHGG